MRDSWRRIVLPSVSRAAAAEMDDELASHEQLHIDDLTRGGMGLEAAREAARVRLDALQRNRSELHRAARRREADMMHRERWDSLRGDIVFGWRQMWRNAAHTLLALITLTLGIGLTTAMFTVIERTMLQPLPFGAASQLVELDGVGSDHTPIPYVSADDWLDWRNGATTLAGTAVYNGPFRAGFQVGDTATRIGLSDVSADFFSVLRPRFLVGRAFTPDEIATPGVAVVSARVWHDYLGSDPTLRKRLGNIQVVGVLAPGVEYPAGADIWMPMAVRADAGGAMRNNINFQAIARLKPGATLAQATADLARVSAGIRQRDGGGIYDYAAVLRPLQDVVVGRAGKSFTMLMMAVAGVLMLVCANLAIATMGRGATRAGEMAVRTSLGATRGRLLKQLLVEQVVIACAGGLSGVALAWALLRILTAMWGDSIPRAADVHIDLAVLGFAAAVSIAVGLLAGLMPALRGSRVSLHEVIKHDARASVGGKSGMVSLLVVVEFALAIVLLSGAGLLLHSLRNVLNTELGFDDRVATVELVLNGKRYPDSTRAVAWEALLDAYRAIPGVRSAAVANIVPLIGGGSGFVDIDGKPVDDRTGSGGAQYRVVSRDYFAALNLRLLEGRVFGPQDARGAPRTVVISASMAKKFWPGQDPIGHRVSARSMEADLNAPPLTVVGVVSDVRQHGPEADVQATMYVDVRQAAAYRTRALTAVVAGTLPEARIIPALRQATHRFDPQLAGDFGTLHQQLRSLLEPRRLTTSLLTGFSALALLLAALGIYATLSYAIAARTRELAMRSALGAQRTHLLRLVLRAGFAAVLPGVAIGLAAAIATNRLLGSLLVGVTAGDPTAYVAATGVLLIVALGAVLIPARRAMRLDPMLVLKGE